MKPVAVALLIVALHLGLASMAAARHLIHAEISIPLLACDPLR